ncbi:hypothetical protein ACJMK2_023508 [Sinanodonta woodiana]|uniref:Uncharacterized protein n=1 Tax=Sinanodonta woodiana TaxID=1069815 RepID=A0ABD3T5E0_SINWO
MLRFYIVTCLKENYATCSKEKDATTLDNRSLQGQCKEVVHDLDCSTGKFLQNDTAQLSDDLPDLENKVTYIDQSGLSNLNNPLIVIDIDDIPINPDDTVQFGPFPSSDEP